MMPKDACPVQRSGLAAASWPRAVSWRKAQPGCSAGQALVLTDAVATSSFSSASDALPATA